MRNYPTHYYKRNKLEQLKTFCAVVECNSHITKTAKKLNISKTSVSLQIKSLEFELKRELFDRKGRRIYLNKTGREYYKEVLPIIQSINKAYNQKEKFKEYSDEKLRKINRFKELRDKWQRQKNLIKIKINRKLAIKPKWLVVFILLLVVSVLSYLYNTNYWFDMKLEKMASPFLKEIMKIEYYRINKNDKCSLLGAQLNEDIASLILRLNNSNISSSGTIAINECPSQAMRMNGEDEVDKMFYNKKSLSCKREEGYPMLQKLSKLTRDILDVNNNFRVYNIYMKTDCVNHDIFKQNIMKYQNQIFYKQISTLDNLSTGRIWFIKHRNYYYLIIQTNGLQGHIEHLKRERYLIFKKLTLNKLMHYDNGYYWKLIKEYNIRID